MAYEWPKPSKSTCRLDFAVCDVCQSLAAVTSRRLPVIAQAMIHTGRQVMEKAVSILQSQTRQPRRAQCPLKQPRSCLTYMVQASS